MRLYIPVVIALLAGLAVADSIEIKTGDGVRANLVRGSGGTSRHTAEYPWVCYDKRIKVVVDGDMYVTYKGCTRVNSSCKRVGRAHFGKYQNDYESYKAYNRCINARPRFVD